MEYKKIQLKDLIDYANTGADAIQRAPIVEYDTGIKCIRIGDISNDRKYDEWGFTEITEENFNKYKLDIGDILIARTGSTIGISKIIKNEVNSVYNNGLIKVKVNKEKCNSNYFYYILQSKEFIDYIQGIAFGTTGQPNMKINDFLKYKTNDIPIDKQNKIVKILSKIDEKIDINNKINDNLLNYIFKQYENISNSITSETELENIANISSGKRPKSKDDSLSIPIIGASGIMSYTNEINYDKDIIIIGRVGTLGIIQRYNYPIWASDNTITIDTNYKNYIENYLKTIDYNSLNRGSTQPLLTQSDIGKQRIKFDEEIVRNFENNIQIFKDKIWNNNNENEQLEKLRDTLLPKLMNGEINLDKIEI